MLSACAGGSPVAEQPSPRPFSPAPSAAATATPTPTPTVDAAGCRLHAKLPAGSVVSVIGDSYTTGERSKGGVGEKGWPAILARRTGWTVFKDAQGASGYRSQGFTGKYYDGLVYKEQVAKLPAQRPDLVIVFGSSNDIGHLKEPGFDKDVAATLQAVRAAAPEAYVVVATTFWGYDDPPAELLRIRDIQKQATADLGCADFLDPIADAWIGQRYHFLIVPGDDHPTDAGHVRLADLWQRDLTRLGFL